MDHLPSLRLLVTFDTVYRLGSMQRAAAALNVTPPAVTKAIRQLEDEIGTPLMDRSSKPAMPTEAGERLAWATRAGLASIENTINDIRNDAGLLDHQVTLTCTIGMATYWLMPRLSTFYAQCPDVTVNVQAPPSDRPILSLGTDIALRYGRGEWKDCETVKLFDERVCPIGTPDVVARAQSLNGLQDAPLIDVRTSSGNKWHSWPDYLRKRGITRRVQSVHTFDNYVQATQATLDGRGLMLGWRSVTDRFVEEGALEQWPDGAVDFGTGYYASVAPSSQSKEATQRVLSWLIDVTKDI
jgi:DNA-binding transcriptional LysR family regulator